MKKILILLTSLLLTTGSTFADPVVISFDIAYEDNSPIIPDYPKTPTTLPMAMQDGNVITFKANHDPYTLCIVDEDGFTVYSVSVPTSVITVILPTWLTGDYEIRLLTGESYYFFGGVTF